MSRRTPREYCAAGGSFTEMSQYEVYNPYHSQGLAAGGSALLDAINKGKIHLAKFILDAGEYDIVNTRDFKGKTPLIRACYIKEEKTRDRAVQLLLSKGANVNLRDEVGRTALSYACEMRCNDIVKILVKNNVNPDIPDILGSTPLIYSSRVGNDRAIEILIRSFRRLGFDIDHVNNEGMTALLTAAKNGFIGCATLLAIDGRANLTVRDPETGMNAEELARMRGCSNSEVLPFSPSANPGQLRLSRCGSLLTSKTSAMGVVKFEEADSTSSPMATSETEVTSALSTKSEIKSVTAEPVQWSLPKNLDQRQCHRQKRHSMPDIHFGSSTNFLPDHPVLPQPLPEKRTDGDGSWSRVPESVAPNSASRIALGPRKSRELVRADTDVTRSDAYYDVKEN